MDLLIKNAKTLDPETGAENLVCAGIENGRICFLGENGQDMEAEHIVDIKGAYLLPGMIAVSYTHLLHGCQLCAL